MVEPQIVPETKIEFWDDKETKLRHYRFGSANRKVTVKHFRQIAQTFVNEPYPKRDKLSGAWVVPLEVGELVNEDITKKAKLMPDPEPRKTQEKIDTPTKEPEKVIYIGEIDECSIKTGTTNDRDWTLLNIKLTDNKWIKAWGKNADKFVIGLRKGIKIKATGNKAYDSKHDSEICELHSDSTLELLETYNGQNINDQIEKENVGVKTTQKEEKKMEETDNKLEVAGDSSLTIKDDLSKKIKDNVPKGKKYRTMGTEVPDSKLVQQMVNDLKVPIATTIIDVGKDDEKAWATIRVSNETTGQTIDMAVVHHYNTVRQSMLLDLVREYQRKNINPIEGYRDSGEPLLTREALNDLYGRFLKFKVFAERSAITVASRAAQLKILNQEWRTEQELAAEKRERQIVEDSKK